MEPISASVVDHSLIVKRHNAYTHMGCVMLRSAIGLSLLAPAVDAKRRRTVSFVLVIALIIFSYKYIFHNVVHGRVFWKNYPRFIMMAAMALYLLNTNRPQMAGIIIIIDAMMGLDTRHTAAVVSHICKH